MGPRWVGDGGGGGGGGGDGDGRIFPGHPGPISNVPRDKISRKGIPHSDYPFLLFEKGEGGTFP